MRQVRVVSRMTDRFAVIKTQKSCLVLLSTRLLAYTDAETDLLIPKYMRQLSKVIIALWWRVRTSELSLTNFDSTLCSTTLTMLEAAVERCTWC